MAARIRKHAQQNCLELVPIDLRGPLLASSVKCLGDLARYRMVIEEAG